MATKSRTEKVAETAKTAVEEARDTATSVASDATQRVKSEARDRAEAVQSGAAGEVDNVASALRKAASEARKGSPQERSFGQMAEVLADASEAIGQKDLGTIASDVSSFARRNPLLFIGGAALAGLAVSRFAKASGSEARHASASGSDIDPYATDIDAARRIDG
ncbi:MAG: hypothetical protein LC676_12950 [Loktanella sp.]|nr:hypothetical protein [Loktanella sp.]